MTNEIKYPIWFNICSLMSLLLIVVGFISLMFNPIIAVLLFGLGYLSLGVFGYIGTVYKLNYLFNMGKTGDEL